MEKKIFVLYDTDSRYVERFLEYVARRQAFPFQVMGFTGEAELTQFIDTLRAAVFLVEERAWRSFSKELQQKIQSQNVLLFLLGAKKMDREETSFLYKYRSVDEILKDVLAAYEESSPSFSIGSGRRTRFLAIYSPAGGYYKTICAMVMGQILAEQERVLYINFDALAGNMAHLEEEGEYSLSDLLYLRKSANGGGRRILGLAKSLGRLAILPPVVNPEDIWEISSGELAELLTEIGSEEVYDTVIVDMGTGKNPLPLLRMCRHIVIPVYEEGASDRQEEEFREYLHRCGEEEILARCHEMTVPGYPGLREGNLDIRELRYGALGQLLEREMASFL